MIQHRTQAELSKDLFLRPRTNRVRITFSRSLLKTSFLCKLGNGRKFVLRRKRFAIPFFHSRWCLFFRLLSRFSSTCTRFYFRLTIHGSYKVSETTFVFCMFFSCICIHISVRYYSCFLLEIVTFCLQQLMHFSWALIDRHNFDEFVTEVFIPQRRMLKRLTLIYFRFFFTWEDRS